MRNIITTAVLLLFITACKKDKKEIPDPVPSQPGMSYFDLKDSTVSLGGLNVLDLDRDGKYDLFCSTLLVGDPVLMQDKWQWLVNSSLEANLPVKNEIVPAMEKGTIIPVQDFSGYGWFNASSIVLAQKVIGLIQPPFWEGAWKGASHQYLPFQLVRPGGLYNGWVELSFNQAGEKVILHKAALSKISNTGIKAGF